MLTIPTWLTLFRIALIPVFILTYYASIEHSKLIAAIIFIIIAFTDWLDGFLARWLDQATSFGEFLDPVADKIVVITALIMLVASYTNIGITLCAITIIIREITLSSLREWIANMDKDYKVAVSALGKIKTTTQLLAIILLIIAIPYSDWQWLGQLMLYIATALTIISMANYFTDAWRNIDA